MNAFTCGYVVPLPSLLNVIFLLGKMVGTCWPGKTLDSTNQLGSLSDAQIMKPMHWSHPMDHMTRYDAIFSIVAATTLQMPPEQVAEKARELTCEVFDLVLTLGTVGSGS